MIENIDVMAHSSIKIRSDKTIYFDPYLVVGQLHDADIVFLTHDHYDHYSPEDLAKVANGETIIVAPRSTEANLMERGEDPTRIVFVEPGQTLEVLGIGVETLPAYNTDKPYHEREHGWVGYVVNVDDTRIYVAGDTDITDENLQVACDIALVPVGGTYTMTPEEAAFLVNAIRPRIAVPTHYRSIVGNPADGAAFAALVDPGIETALKIPFDD